MVAKLGCSLTLQYVILGIGSKEPDLESIAGPEDLQHDQIIDHYRRKIIYIFQAETRPHSLVPES